jgi:N-acetylglucosaminyldiphosphoundecaprenol N-acetyl-beta-D-mannosaminyltransferase
MFGAISQNARSVDMSRAEAPSDSLGVHVAFSGTKAVSDEFEREVFVVLGIPIDLIDMTAMIRRLEAAVASNIAFLISTVNVNFLIMSQSDAEFRESLLFSDLCTADGMPIVWFARLLGIPLEKISGTDLFERLKTSRSYTQRLKILLFGGAQDIATAASEKLNVGRSGITCVGSYFPGFGTSDEMSTNAIIDAVNSSNADFLVAALGAKKGQTWLLRNHNRIRIPIRAHLGMTVNIQAGALKRAPVWMQNSGLEWLWRIKEEPKLGRRYWNDGLALLRLIITRALPLVVLHWAQRWSPHGKSPNAWIEQVEDQKTITLKLYGSIIARNIGDALPYFRYAAATAKDVVINLAETRLIDARFLGLLFVLDRQLSKHKKRLGLTGVSPRISRLIRLQGFGHLLAT